MAAIIQPSNRNRQETLQAECLRRDGFRCAYTLLPDENSARKRLIDVPAGATVMETNLSHILPLALRTFDGAVQREKDAVAMVWHGLYRYFPQIKNKIDSGSLNQHENLITFATTTHARFDNHRLAFEPVTNQPNKYRIRILDIYPPSFQPPPGHRDLMILRSSDNNFPLPDPDYFRVHYTIAKILDVSGIGEEIEAEISASRLDPENLNPDGSTDLGAILCRKMLMNI
ncbi:hypothetical protein LY78DRAFT_576915 [Colletotrichum sublineola]|nr:hypothetical protein LY78DRAFT_576915 [Colletotrichum sublineola]